MWKVTLAGVRVLESPFGLPYAGCVTPTKAGVTQAVEASRRPPQVENVPVQYDALVNKSYSATEKLATLAHELGHLLFADAELFLADYLSAAKNLRETRANSFASAFLVPEAGARSLAE